MESIDCLRHLFHNLLARGPSESTCEIIAIRGGMAAEDPGTELEQKDRSGRGRAAMAAIGNRELSGIRETKKSERMRKKKGGERVYIERPRGRRRWFLGLFGF